jgi:hypothetical protein
LSLADPSAVTVNVTPDVADAGQPPRRLRGEPVGDRNRTASRENVDEAAFVEVDDPGDQQRRMLGRCRQERGLVQPDGAGRAEACEMIDPRPAVVTYRRHRRVP